MIKKQITHYTVYAIVLLLLMCTSYAVKYEPDRDAACDDFIVNTTDLMYSVDGSVVTIYGSLTDKDGNRGFLDNGLIIFVKAGCDDGSIRIDKLTITDEVAKYDLTTLNDCIKCSVIEFIFCPNTSMLGNDESVLRECLDINNSVTLPSLPKYDKPYTKDRKTYQYCPPTTAGMPKQACILLTLMFGILGGAIYMSGSSPFRFFSFQKMRMPKTKSYTMRTKSMSFTMMSVVSTVGKSTGLTKKAGKALGKLGGKIAKAVGLGKLAGKSKKPSVKSEKPPEPSKEVNITKKGIGKAVEKATGFVGMVGRSVGKAGEWTGRQVGTGARKFSKTKFARSIGKGAKAVGKAGKWTGRQIGTGAKGVAKAAKYTGKKTGITWAGRQVGKGAKGVAKAAKYAGEKTGVTWAGEQIGKGAIWSAKNLPKGLDQMFKGYASINMLMSSISNGQLLGISQYLPGSSELPVSDLFTKRTMGGLDVFRSAGFSMGSRELLGDVTGAGEITTQIIMKMVNQIMYGMISQYTGGIASAASVMLSDFGDMCESAGLEEMSKNLKTASGKLSGVLSLWNITDIINNEILGYEANTGKKIMQEYSEIIAMTDKERDEKGYKIKLDKEGKPKDNIIMKLDKTKLDKEGKPKEKEYIKFEIKDGKFILKRKVKTGWEKAVLTKADMNRILSTSPKEIRESMFVVINGLNDILSLSGLTGMFGDKNNRNKLTELINGTGKPSKKKEDIGYAQLYINAKTSKEKEKILDEFKQKLRKIFPIGSEYLLDAELPGTQGHLIAQLAVKAVKKEKGADDKIITTDTIFDVIENAQNMIQNNSSTLIALAGTSLRAAEDVKDVSGMGMLFTGTYFTGLPIIEDIRKRGTELWYFKELVKWGYSKAKHKQLNKAYDIKNKMNTLEKELGEGKITLEEYNERINELNNKLNKTGFEDYTLEDLNILRDQISKTFKIEIDPTVKDWERSLTENINNIKIEDIKKAKKEKKFEQKLRKISDKYNLKSKLLKDVGVWINNPKNLIDFAKIRKGADKSINKHFKNMTNDELKTMEGLVKEILPEGYALAEKIATGKGTKNDRIKLKKRCREADKNDIFYFQAQDYENKADVSIIEIKKYTGAMNGYRTGQQFADDFEIKIKVDGKEKKVIVNFENYIAGLKENKSEAEKNKQQAIEQGDTETAKKIGQQINKLDQQITDLYEKRKIKLEKKYNKLIKKTSTEWSILTKNDEDWAKLAGELLATEQALLNNRKKMLENEGKSTEDIEKLLGTGQISSYIEMQKQRISTVGAAMNWFSKGVNGFAQQITFSSDEQATQEIKDGTHNFMSSISNATAQNVLEDYKKEEVLDVLKTGLFTDAFEQAGKAYESLKDDPLLMDFATDYFTYMGSENVSDYFERLEDVTEDNNSTSEIINNAGQQFSDNKEKILDGINELNKNKESNVKGNVEIQQELSTTVEKIDKAPENQKPVLAEEVTDIVKEQNESTIDFIEQAKEIHRYAPDIEVSEDDEMKKKDDDNRLFLAQSIGKAIVNKAKYQVENNDYWSDDVVNNFEGISATLNSLELIDLSKFDLSKFEPETEKYKEEYEKYKNAMKENDELLELSELLVQSLATADNTYDDYKTALTWDDRKHEDMFLQRALFKSTIKLSQWDKNMNFAKDNINKGMEEIFEDISSTSEELRREELSKEAKDELKEQLIKDTKDELKEQLIKDTKDELKEQLENTNIPAINNLSYQTSKFKKSIMNAQFSWDEWEDYMRAFVRGNWKMNKTPINTFFY